MTLLKFIGAGIVLTICVILAFVFGVAYGIGFSKRSQDLEQEYAINTDAVSEHQVQELLERMRNAEMN
jgi:hypothetical protein